MFLKNLYNRLFGNRISIKEYLEQNSWPLNPLTKDYAISLAKSNPKHLAKRVEESFSQKKLGSTLNGLEALRFCNDKKIIIDAITYFLNADNPVCHEACLNLIEHHRYNDTLETINYVISSNKFSPTIKEIAKNILEEWEDHKDVIWRGQTLKYDVDLYQYRSYPGDKYRLSIHYHKLWHAYFKASHYPLCEISGSGETIQEAIDNCEKKCKEIMSIMKYP
jgi:predicted nucleic acid-binding Zn ribbon protein